MADQLGVDMSPGWRLVDAETLTGPPAAVAPTLLGRVLVRRHAPTDDGTVEGARWARIVEVEAYAGADDPASHAARGRTSRNATMFGRAGLLYVYFTYGMHHCANVVVGPDGEPGAVLVRAAEPIGGLDLMAAARTRARSPRQLCSGPAKLCEALSIDRVHDGVDLLDAASPVLLVDDGVAPPRRPERSGRIGIRVATERPWRFCVPASPWTSRPSGARRAGGAPHPTSSRERRS